MRLINSKEIKIFEIKLCHNCRSNIIYTRYPNNPIKNKGYVLCDCGNKQIVYDPYFMYAMCLTKCKALQ